MAKPYCYEYPRPMVSVDVVVFGLDGDALRALFIRRKKDPFADHWAIPGGFLDIDEPIEAAARRELKEESGLADLAAMAEIGVFGEPDRDPRGRVISVAHAAIVRGPLPRVQGGDDASEAAWIDPDIAGPLAFDHPQILQRARRWLRLGVERKEVDLAFLPETFSLADVHAMLGAALGPGASASTWVNESRLAGRIEEVAGSAGRYQKSS